MRQNVGRHRQSRRQHCHRHQHGQSGHRPIFSRRRREFHRLPELGDLIQRVSEAAIKGYLKGIDGRLIKVRQIYSALNTLLQGGGAVVMKRALVILYDKATKAGLDFKFVGNIHDEIQAEVADADVETYSAFALEAMVEAGEYYNMRCPLEGTVKSGASWADTH